MHPYQKIDKIEDDEETLFEEHEEPSEKPKEKWSTRMKLVAFVTFMVHFIVFGAIAVIMPYFPIVVSADLSIQNCFHAFDFVVFSRKLYIITGSVSSQFEFSARQSRRCVSSPSWPALLPVGVFNLSKPLRGAPIRYVYFQFLNCLFQIESQFFFNW